LKLQDFPHLLSV